MAFIPVPSGIQLCFDFATAGQLWQFCLHLKKASGSVTPSDLDNVNAAASDWWDSNLKTRLSEDVTLRQVRSTDVSVEGGQQKILSVGTAGTVGNQATALNAALVTSLRTNLRGRSYRGRVYVSGYSETIAGTVAVGSTTAANQSSDFAALDGVLDAAGYEVVVASKQHNGSVTSPAVTNRVSTYITDVNLDSQRRRLAGRGT